MREIKEVRPGKNSRDFSRWPEEANNAKANRCFVVFYGSDFNLKVVCKSNSVQRCPGTRH